MPAYADNLFYTSILFAPKKISISELVMRAQCEGFAHGSLSAALVMYLPCLSCADVIGITAPNDVFVHQDFSVEIARMWWQ